MPPKKRQATVNANNQSTNDDTNAANEFEKELSWCIRQLELGLCNQKPDSRQAAEAIKVLKILRSDKAPLVKKRQAMRNTFGDYRQKIKEEEKKNATKMKKLKVTPVSTDSNKSVFYKKSLKKANESYVTMMASINVNDEKSQTDITRLMSDNTQGESGGFKFGFQQPSSCESVNTTDSAICNGDKVNSDVTCPSHDPSDNDHDKCAEKEGSNHNPVTKFVMSKSDNSFQFNFDIPP
ncbi:unnamed protein product [Mytilus coruscus]|uniref:Uncharacterized protein n=1 Tax=Mytilus coruscus TaxID=42192 RepID=A0A6J8D1X8_MYTCO|nr:unnamed protein product [Mytilus coruscus]